MTSVESTCSTAPVGRSLIILGCGLLTAVSASFTSNVFSDVVCRTQFSRRQFGSKTHGCFTNNSSYDGHRLKENVLILETYTCGFVFDKFLYRFWSKNNYWVAKAVKSLFLFKIFSECINKYVGLKHFIPTPSRLYLWIRLIYHIKHTLIIYIQFIIILFI